MYCLVLLSGLLACVAGVQLNTTEPRQDGRLIGGSVTDIISHPYQVSILLGGSHKCTGSIISVDWVVTLAFCVKGVELRYIRVMSGSTYSNAGGTLHTASNVIGHNNYDGVGGDYDVAVVQVFPAFTFSASVQPITLKCDPVPAGTNVVLTGWGDAYIVNTLLEQVTLKISSDSECKYFYGGLITDRMICAGDPNGAKAACGDYGAPLVASKKLVGMYSWGGCTPQRHQVYTKVSAVCDWIVINAGL